MLDHLPSELLHRIIIYACPIISLSITPIESIENGPAEYFQAHPPSVIASLALSCSKVHNAIKFTDNASLYAKVFERTFDFDAARRRLGLDWAGAHGIAWEGRKRWAMIRRMRNVVGVWESDGYHGFQWLDEYGEEDIRSDLWTIYLMILENDGKNAILLTQCAKLGPFVEMLCRIHFGRRMVRRVGWPKASQERSLLVWILYALDPMPSDFVDQDLYNKTKLCMRAFIFASFKYSLGTLPPTYFFHPSAFNPSHYSHQVPATALIPYPLNPLSSARYASWTPPPDPPLYKYSNDPLVPILMYAHTVYMYPPSLAVTALLWYFRGSNAIIEPPVIGSPKQMNDDDDTDDIVLPRKPPRQDSGNDTPSTDSMSGSNPSSATRSLFSAFRSDAQSWSAPLLFAIPPAPPNVPQSTLNKAFRNELYRRRFNAASRQLDQEWSRRLEGQMRFNGPGRVEGFVPGTLEGVWEGGFLYLDFPDYTQFLTGEREATPDFYQLPPEKVYGANRQVWRLKEYEVQTLPDGSELSPLFDGSPVMKGSTRYESPNMGKRMTASATSSSSSNQPLSIGKWMDGWLPPADTLRWRFAEDGDELEIVEKIRATEGTTTQTVEKQRRKASDGPGDSLTNSVSSGTKFVVTVSDGEDSDDVGWGREKEVLGGKIRGRSDVRAPTKPAPLVIQPTETSATPVGRPLPELPPEFSPTPRLASPNVATFLPSSSSRGVGPSKRDDALSPPLSPPINHSLSPPIKEPKDRSKRFSWSWKSRDSKSKNKEKSPPRDPDEVIRPVYYRSSLPRSQTREQSPQKQPGIISPPPEEDSFATAKAEQAKIPDPFVVDNDSDVDEEDQKVVEPVGEPDTMEKVSRYVRWDPNVAWAKQAIWGGRSAGGGSARSSQQGKLRGMTESTTSTASGKTPAGTGLSKTGSATSGSTRMQRQVKDILIFGESHSSWGEGTIRGRIRSHDGLITLVKTYPQRATWIYTGYVIGGESLVGRWRDANSPEEVNGYEGPFSMKRRR